MPFAYKARHITPMGQVHADVGDLAGSSVDRPEWVCVESGTPGRWVRVPAEPLDLDAILTRANRATGGDMDTAFVSADEDVPALVDEVRRLRAALADAHEGMGDMISYVPAIFREKWEHDAYLTRARQALRTAGVEVPS